ncbi:MAG: FAD-dependent oxidoreductase [Deltaproteobacteria bacterium]|jgi:L-2-hydroxyglutarate oxidase LhgO|nr:FAD-dependent oxidoreductase [Deltaproteobacteria bacterium]
MSEKINIAIIGGGIIGCCLALELAKTHSDIYVFEKNPGITSGENQSSRNSGVLHAGIYYEQDLRPLKAQFCVEGNRLWYAFAQKYQLPCRQTGKLIVANDETESRKLDHYLQQANINGVPDVRKISAAEIKQLEPNVNAHSALLVPTSGIIDPTALLHQVYASASNRGAQFMPETEIIDLELSNGDVRVFMRYRDGQTDHIRANTVINAAGIRAVDVARMLDPQIPVKPALIRGDSYKFYRSRRPRLFLKGMNVYPTPIIVDSPTGRHHTVGVHLTPTFDYRDGKFIIGDTVTVGPKLIPVNDFDDYSTAPAAPEAFLKKMDFFPDLKASDLEYHQGGIQARLDGYHDFFIKPDRHAPQVIHLLGIDSPGLTAAPAIAKFVGGLLDRIA